MSIDYGISSLYIKSKHDSGLIAVNQDLPFESSSTIKIPIIYLALKKAVDNEISLQKIFLIEPRHLSSGSGIINWTNWRQLSLAQLIACITTYSDCVATNVLIEFVGGKRIINQFLKQQGLQTRLLMPSLIFTDTDRELVMPKVGITTAHELAYLFKLLMRTDWPEPYQQFLINCLSNVDTSWLQESMPGNPGIKLWHKTGSMINVGKTGDTVFNAVGIIRLREKEYCFALMSRKVFGSVATNNQLSVYKQELINLFQRNLELLT